MTSHMPPGDSQSDGSQESSMRPYFESPYTVSVRTRNAIASAIAGVWVAAFVADVASESFETSPFIHMAMLGLAAAIFGSGFVKGIK